MTNALREMSMIYCSLTLGPDAMITLTDMSHQVNQIVDLPGAPRS